MDTRDNLLAGPGERTCWSCGAVIDGADNFCRKCGKGQDGHIPWQYKHWGVIVITLLGLGPFSLIFVWRSPVISRNAKIAYTGFILLLTWFVIDRLYRTWLTFQALLGGAQVY